MTGDPTLPLIALGTWVWIGLAMAAGLVFTALVVLGISAVLRYWRE
jgi:amino acid transporter